MGEPRRGLAGLTVFAGILFALFSAESTLISTRITFDLGTPGTYVFDEEPSCGGREPAPCHSCSGTFTSDDGLVTRTDVSLSGSFGQGLGKGSRFRAFDVGCQKSVYSPETRNGKVGEIEQRMRDLDRVRLALLEIAANGVQDRCPVLAALSD